MNKYLQFAIIVEVKESFEDSKKFRDYNCIKEGDRISYINEPLYNKLKKYINTQQERKIKYKHGAIFDKEIRMLRDVFVYSDGRLIKFLIDEENKIVTKYILHRGSVDREYADISRKFAIEEFYSENEQGSYMRINNYMVFYGNEDVSTSTMVRKFLEDIIKINDSDNISTDKEFSNIKIYSSAVKEMLITHDDLKFNIDLYSKVLVDVDEKIKDNKIENFKVNVINIEEVATNC